MPQMQVRLQWEPTDAMQLPENQKDHMELNTASYCKD